jgi:choline-glycine betaine transporter
MKTAKKVITGIVVVLVALVVLAVVLFALFGNRALKMGIETAGTNTLKVPVSLKDINLSLLGGSVRMNDLVIGNPAGYQHPNFLTM